MSKALLSFSRSLALNERDIYFSGVYDVWDTFEPATRMYSFRESREGGPWGDADFHFHTASLCKYVDPASNGQPYFVALSSEGDVYHHGLTEGFTERIQGAGIWHDDSKRYGRMTSIRQIGDKLYACGSGGQIYVRHGRDDWRFLTKTLLWDPKKFSDAAQNMPDEEKEPAAYKVWKKAYVESQKDNVSYLLRGINGPSEDEIYICGSNGLLYLWDGESLEDMESDVPNALIKIHVADDGVVWICGSEGQILSIDQENGLEHHTDDENEHLFISITTYQGRVLLASNASPWGVFEFNPDSEELTEIVIDKDYPPKRLHTVDTVGDVLWVVGTRDIFRLKDDIWERIEHPDIPHPSKR